MRLLEAARNLVSPEPPRYLPEETYTNTTKRNIMKAIHIRKRVLLTALAIVAAIAIYRIAFHVPAPAFIEEAVHTVAQ